MGLEESPGKGSILGRAPCIRKGRAACSDLVWSSSTYIRGRAATRGPNHERLCYRKAARLYSEGNEELLRGFVVI